MMSLTAKQDPLRNVATLGYVRSASVFGFFQSICLSFSEVWVSTPGSHSYIPNNSLSLSRGRIESYVTTFSI